MTDHCSGGDTELNTRHKWEPWGLVAHRQGERMDGKLLRNLVRCQGSRGKNNLVIYGEWGFFYETGLAGFFFSFAITGLSSQQWGLLQLRAQGGLTTFWPRSDSLTLFTTRELLRDTRDRWKVKSNHECNKYLKFTRCHWFLWSLPGDPPRQVQLLPHFTGEKNEAHWGSESLQNDSLELAELGVNPGNVVPQSPQSPPTSIQSLILVTSTVVIAAMYLWPSRCDEQQRSLF